MNFQPRPHLTTADRRLPFDCIALLLQGGGALGAYQGGVYEALAEANIHPDWIAGISIGAINAAIIAGNPPNSRVDRLREFWTQVTSGRAVHRFDEQRSHPQFSQSGECELCGGVWRERIFFCAATGAMAASGWNACRHEHLRHERAEDDTGAPRRFRSHQRRHDAVQRRCRQCEDRQSGLFRHVPRIRFGPSISWRVGRCRRAFRRSKSMANIIGMAAWYQTHRCNM